MSGEGKTVSLILGSGGARGMAHIGVIRYLEESDYRIRSIAGCSIGAVIGGVYAAGKLDEYERWVRSIDAIDIVSLLDITWQKGGFVKGEKIINTLRELVGDCDIEDLSVRYTAVASDIKAEKEIWIQSGSLFDAMRASMSLPLFFTPFELDGAMLIDGGVLNPVPIAPTFSDDTELKIAVNLSGRMDSHIEHIDERPAKSDNEEQDDGQSSVRASISRFIDNLRGSLTRDDDDEWGAYDIANQAFDAMQGTISRQKLAAYPPDTVITIPRNACGTLEFDRAAEMIELGYDLAKAQLSDD